MGKKVSKRLVQEGKKRLLDAKEEIRRHFEEMSLSLKNRQNVTSTGDEGDQSHRVFEENNLYQKHARLRQRSEAIDRALERVEEGTYGICSVTEDPIEPERLSAFPWTDVSSEGAEIREEEMSSARR